MCLLGGGEGRGGVGRGGRVETSQDKWQSVEGNDVQSGGSINMGPITGQNIHIHYIRTYVMCEGPCTGSPSPNTYMYTYIHVHMHTYVCTHTHTGPPIEAGTSLILFSLKDSICRF